MKKLLLTLCAIGGQLAACKNDKHTINGDVVSDQAITIRPSCGAVLRSNSAGAGSAATVTNGSFRFERSREG